MITLRLATLEDASRIQKIAEDTWPISYEGIISPNQIRYMLDLMYSKTKIETAIKDQNQAFWLADKDGETLGFCSIEFGNPSSEYLRIHKLYLLPETQGLGIGKLLIDKITHEGLSHELSFLHLNVNKHNKAFHFYQKLGFEVEREEVIDIGNDYIMDDFVMVKAIR
ncbi:GNAT family N-acetyltransferase [Fluviicola taffensis]|uniref:GCN5-related N-acetyltransferase n=1 Tax=Fluviicola taffensis (strain DSM 16823 / NCIMB 13979 / RW262) TaxID=755732 RepID=F2IEQ6_FLUTR|nr:GNAT family N-acetyltransferase [Fluviicola taffensis]AEA45623.1 GCN5-related N-acetyltransferase [Fluviicola taffensis DSM 16823]